jgi:hypothetical protein
MFLQWRWTGVHDKSFTKWKALTHTYGQHVVVVKTTRKSEVVSMYTMKAHQGMEV